MLGVIAFFFVDPFSFGENLWVYVQGMDCEWLKVWSFFFFFAAELGEAFLRVVILEGEWFCN